MNLGAGSEFGIYKIEEHPNISEFTMPDRNRIMTNSTYYFDTNIANWQPAENQWWSVIFNPSYKNISHAKDLTLIGSIDFSTSYSEELFYNSFKKEIMEGSVNPDWRNNNNRANAKDYLIFDDDNHMVWVFWWGVGTW